MYHGVTRDQALGFVIKPRGRVQQATKQQSYRMPNRVHSVQVSGMGADEYFGPPRPGQTFAEYQTWMSTQNVVAVGSGVVAAMMINPLVGVAVGVGAWLLAPQVTKRAAQKARTGGGY